MKLKRMGICAAAVLLLTGCGVDASQTAAVQSGEKTEVTEELTDTTAPAETTTAESDDTTTAEAADTTPVSADGTTGAASLETTQREPESESDRSNSFVITLYPEVAPITCANFIWLVEDGFYDGVCFHRVVDDFVVQGGDPTGTGMGGSDQTIKGEFSENGVENNLSHQRGVISMARSAQNDSASSQFFICYTDCSFLDGNYAAFGEVTEGMEVVDSFLQVERSYGSDGALSSPDTPIVMRRVRMLSNDADGNPRVLVMMNDFLSESVQSNEEQVITGSIAKSRAE